MTALADVLKKAGYTRVVLMTQTNVVEEGARFLPMAANIRTSLKGMLADLSPDDTVLVALPGTACNTAARTTTTSAPWTPNSRTRRL